MRYIAGFVEESLKSRAVFIGGPRQVGKTTFALSLIANEADARHPAYLNWDHAPSAEKIRKTMLPAAEPLLVFDELHKFKAWKRWIKGVIDVEKKHRRIIVTGSARLDLYQKGGDSLFGRYRYVRLHPFSLMELNSLEPRIDLGTQVERLLKFGGFPEPLFSVNERRLKLWQRERMRRIVLEDIRDISVIQNLSGVESLAELLPGRVGSPLSIKSLSEDIQVDHKTISRWLVTLESMYVCFRIAPFGTPKIRAVKKEQKLYLWDWSTIEDPGARWENMVASQLLKYCHWLEDSEGETMELRFIRDVDRREVDFVVLKDKRPIFAVECKTGEKAVGKSVRYFAERLQIPVFYQVHRGTAEFGNHLIQVMPFTKFCSSLGMP